MSLPDAPSLTGVVTEDQLRATAASIARVQEPSGAIPWFPNGHTDPWDHVECAMALADWVGDAQPDWELDAGRLAHVVSEHPEAFLDKSRYLMDWYYPVLGGAVRGEVATTRLRDKWDAFVVPGLGIRCVSDQPWVTGAETCELVLALDAAGDIDAASALFADMQHLRCDDGAYWTGWQFRERVNWPDEHTTWTAAAVVLAVDALSRTSPGNGIFRADRLPAGVDLIPDPVCGCSSTAGLSEHP